MKKYIVVTGGAGFVGSNLIESLIKKTKYTIISLDNYSTGSRRNHIISKKVIYIKGDTIKIEKKLSKYKKKLNQFFILVSFLEYFKVLENFKSVTILIQSEAKRYLNFV